MKFFRCVAFDVEYVVLADTSQEATERLKATPTLAALLKEYEEEGEVIQEKDFSVVEMRTLEPGIAWLG